MAFTCNLGISHSGVGDAISKTIAYSNDAVDLVNIAVPAPSTNLAVALSIDVSELKYLYIVADQVLTLKTNSTGTPANTIVLVAGLPLIWVHNYYYSNPLAAADVTILYVTNASGTAATLQLIALEDPTA